MLIPEEPGKWDLLEPGNLNMLLMSALIHRLISSTLCQRGGFYALLGQVGSKGVGGNVAEHSYRDTDTVF